ncbi:MAG TPA: hypothetical protein VGR28_04655, partial [Candidatus Thermoplasmatota archaeon]|nr:hypothetical protein [Candidatus Thermoplasmatota archaeon]
GVAVAVLGGLAAILLTSPDPSAPEAAALLPWLTLAAAPLPLAWAEARRGSPTWALTNLRVVQRTGLWKQHEDSWRWPRLNHAILQPRGPAALDLGDLVVAGEGVEVRLAGVRPLHKLRDDIELLLHTAPVAPYLGDQRDAADKVARLLRPGDRR